MEFSKENLVSKSGHKEFYRKNDVFCKVFDDTFSKSDILNEALNQARVEETGLHIPVLREVEKVNGKWAIEYDFIEGKTLKVLMDENPDKEDEYLDLFVNIQMDIHSRTCPMLGRLIEKMQRKISASSFDATTRYELHTRLDGMPKHTKLCHGDFNPSNVIISTDGTPFVIDWAHATQGNASADAARTYLLFCLEGRQALADKYLAKFCKKSDTAKQYVQKWMPIVAASQSVKGKPEEKEFLEKWVNVVEYE